MMMMMLPLTGEMIDWNLGLRDTPTFSNGCMLGVIYYFV